jgi:hypothetical protein
MKYKACVPVIACDLPVVIDGLWKGNFAIGSPTNDFLGLGRHFLSRKFPRFRGKWSFSTATGFYVNAQRANKIQAFEAHGAASRWTSSRIADHTRGIVLAVWQPARKNSTVRRATCVA